METKEKIFKLSGRIQHYDWGGFDFIPALLGLKNIPKKTFAEYWLGAHHTASSSIIIKNKKYNLKELIEKKPGTFLGKRTFRKFKSFPYLLKIMDVKNMLSIQVHPSKAGADKGFEEEERLKIPISAPHRNYKDKNHKPEMLVALSDFYLLHGFKKKKGLQKTLTQIKEFESFAKIFDKGNYKALYEHVMLMPQREADKILLPLIKKEIAAKKKNLLTKKDAGWWTAKLFEEKKIINNFDKGIFSIYFFNIVHVKKDEAIFQDAGLPHAYLEGQNMELMASSDNVLRAGLTTKHIDVNELMKHVLFEGIKPKIIKADKKNVPEKKYKTKAEDFAMSKIELYEKEFYVHKSSSPEIFCILEGSVEVNGSNTLEVKKGEAFIVFPEEKYRISTADSAVLYKAFVPKN